MRGGGIYKIPIILVFRYIEGKHGALSWENISHTVRRTRGLENRASSPFFFPLVSLSLSFPPKALIFLFLLFIYHFQIAPTYSFL
jgi:hypothetical protein